MERHKQAVGKIAAAVRGFFERKEPYRIFHGSTNSTRPRPPPGARVVDISALSHVVSVNRAARTALVEPNVPMDRLVETTLREGLVPPVVMEFPGITAGGGFAGTAGESSSFRHGFFNDTVNYVEMVLGNGDVVRAEPHGERADLFRGAAGAVGTLGVTTLMELRLVEAKRWVRTTYHRAHSVAEAVAKLQEETRNPANDYVDGILFSKDHGVVVTGQMTDEKPDDAAVQTFSRAWDPWFYLHVEERTKNLTPAEPSTSDTPSADATTSVTTATTSPSSSASSSSATDYVPLAEYLFRYDRAGFWVGRQGWTYFKYVPFNAFFRWFLDDFMHTRMLYRALHASGESARFVVQDLALPYAKAEEFVDYTADQFGIWPLWLCPLKQTLPPTFHPYTGETEPAPAPDAANAAAAVAAQPTAAAAAAAVPKDVLNIGLWGWGPADHELFIQKNRALEDKLVELGGRKWLYAHTYYSEDEFWRVYNDHGESASASASERPSTKAWYEALRKKYHAETLPTVYDKVRIDVDAARAERAKWRMSMKSRWPVGGLYGILRSIQSGDYSLHRNAEWKHKGE
ncbi:d-3-phosphoglycerate dehydrogenase [Purpureocillium lavendulum]|uniref:Delta(24)-sterol reductase n=1 Tax=Purpureocillium lavendulum TaxID=1247861 RepID=A0AB34FHR1_9HYPO|nr:d-3-phosphoglycerate dehydrogenase [Purpureocillium lavendulum]